MARDVVEKLEESENFEDENEAGGENGKIKQKRAEQIPVHELWETGSVVVTANGLPNRNRAHARLCGGFTVGRVGGSRFDRTPRAPRAPRPGLNPGPDAREPIFAGHLLHAREQNDSGDESDEVGEPRAESRRNFALPRKPAAQDKNEVIAADEQERHEKSHGAAATAGARGKRNGEQRENDAGAGECEALFRFDKGFARAGALRRDQLRNGFFSGASDYGARLFEAAEFDGPIALAECGDQVFVRVGGNEFVCAAVAQVQIDARGVRFALVARGNYNRVFRDGEFGVFIGADLREKHAMPMRGGSSGVLHVEDEVREALIENARLNLKGCLRRRELIFSLAQIADGARAEPERHHESERGSGEGERADRDEHAAHADADGIERNKLAIGAHAAEADEDSDEHGDGQTEFQDRRESAKKKQRKPRRRGGMTDNELHHLQQTRNEKNESEDREADQRVRKYFAADVAIDQFHRSRESF
jgi:hypothetical protein